MTKALHHFFSPSGRVDRQSWWLSVVVLLALLFVVNFGGIFWSAMYYCIAPPSDVDYARYCPESDFFRDPSPITWWIRHISLPLGLWCTFAISTKRLHDQSVSAWWHLLNLIPIIGFLLWLVVLGFFAGDDVTNKYGDR